MSQRPVLESGFCPVCPVPGGAAINWLGKFPPAHSIHLKHGRLKKKQCRRPCIPVTKDFGHMEDETETPFRRKISVVGHFRGSMGLSKPISTLGAMADTQLPEAARSSQNEKRKCVSGKHRGCILRGVNLYRYSGDGAEDPLGTPGCPPVLNFTRLQQTCGR